MGRKRGKDCITGKEDFAHVPRCTGICSHVPVSISGIPFLAHQCLTLTTNACQAVNSICVAIQQLSRQDSAWFSATSALQERKIRVSFRAEAEACRSFMQRLSWDLDILSSSLSFPTFSSSVGRNQSHFTHQFD